MLKLIVAFDPNQLIGIDDKLIWHIKEDLEHFKETTINQTMVMGDVTFFGIGKPLPNRKTIILTLDKEFTYKHKNVSICNDFNELVKKYANNIKEDLYIAGGRTIYKLFIPYVDEMIISYIKKEHEGNVYFPKYDKTLFTSYKEKEYKDFIIKWYKKNK